MANANEPRRFRLNKDDKIVISGTNYRRLQTNNNGHRLGRVDGSQIEEFISHADFHRMLLNNELSVYGGWYAVGEAEIRAHNDNAQLSDLPINEQEEIFLRESLLKRLLSEEREHGRVSRSDAGIRQFVARHWPEVMKDEAAKKGMALRYGAKNMLSPCPQPSTVRDWLSRYRAANYNPLALRPAIRKRGNSTPRFDSDTYAAAKQFVDKYTDSRRTSKSMLYEEYEAHVGTANAERSEKGEALLNLIGRRSFERMIDNLDPYLVVRAREGDAAAHAQFGATFRGLDLERPGQRIEMDECHLDLHALLVKAGVLKHFSPEQRKDIERVRPYLTVAIDVCTKCVMGLVAHVEAPSAATAIACLEMTVMDKTALAAASGAETPWDAYGPGETYAVDTGASLFSNAMHSAVGDLRGKIVHPVVGMPKLRGTIERFFRTLQNGLIRHFSGQTFGNVVEKGDYNSQANASVTVEDIARLVTLWVTDVYHNTPHESLGGATPRDTWLKLSNRFPLMPPPSPENRRHIFGLQCARSISKRGIRLMGIHYQSKALQQFRREVGQRKVFIRVDRNCLAEISVRKDVSSGWIRVPAVDYGVDLRGVTYWEWVATARDLSRKNIDMARLTQGKVQRALARIREDADMAMQVVELSSLFSADDIARVERDLLATFDFQEQGPDDFEESVDEAADFTLDDAPRQGAPKPAPTKPKPAVEPDNGELNNDDDWSWE